MNEQLVSVKLCEVNNINIQIPTRLRLRMDRLISKLNENGKLEDVLRSAVLPRLLTVKSNLFFYDFNPFFQTLSTRYPLIEIKFSLIPIPQNETRKLIRERIVRKMQMESLLSVEAIEVFAFEKANNTNPLLRRAEYAAVLGCKPNSLNYYDKNYTQIEVQSGNSVIANRCNYLSALKHVSELPARKAEGAEDND